MVDHIMKAADMLKEKMAKNPLEKALNEATSDVNWNASNKLLQEIADHTYSFGDFSEVMKYIWKRLSSERKQWRKILKTLTLIDYLIKNGSPRCIQEFKDEIYQIRTLQDFSHYEDGQDRGAAIREVAKKVVQLLGDQQKIEEERKKSQEMRERLGDLRGMGSGGEKSGGSGFSSSSYSSKYEGFSSSKGGKTGGSNYAGGGSDAFKGYSDSTRYDGEVKKKTRDWKVEGSTKESEKDEYVVKPGTKYDAPAGDGDKNNDKSKSVASSGPKKLAPPKGSKIVTQQQQEVNLFEMDAPSHTSAGPSNTATTNSDFNWEAPQAEPKADNSWNWSQAGTTNQPAQPATQPNSNPFDWNQGQQQAAPTPQPTSTNITNLYQQQPPANQFGFQQQPVGQTPFNFGNAPQPTQNNMNNLSSQLGQLSFTSNPVPTPGGGNLFPSAPQTQSTNVSQPTGFGSNPSPHKNDGFDDFQTAKPTGNANVNEYKNYSQAEKSIIDLSDITNEATKKKEQQNKITASKNSNEGFLYSTNDDLDNFFVHSNQSANMQGNMAMNMGMGSMGMGMSGMGGGYNAGMMGVNQNMRAAGGMQPMGGMNMGGMAPMGGMGMNMGYGQNMGGMNPNMGGMNPNMGGMNPNANFNPMMGQMGGNMQQGFGNPSMGGMNSGFGYR